VGIGEAMEVWTGAWRGEGLVVRWMGVEMWAEEGRGGDEEEILVVKRAIRKKG
jgi:hypothetical protein